MTLCATSPDGAFLCNTGNNIVGASTLTAHIKKTFTNVTSQLTVLHNVCFTDQAEGFICEDVFLFQELFNGFVWEYDNNGLRLAQLRFYAQ